MRKNILRMFDKSRLFSRICNSAFQQGTMHHKQSDSIQTSTARPPNPASSNPVHLQASLLGGASQALRCQRRQLSKQSRAAQRLLSETHATPSDHDLAASEPPSASERCSPPPSDTLGTPESICSIAARASRHRDCRARYRVSVHRRAKPQAADLRSSLGEQREGRVERLPPARAIGARCAARSDLALF